MYIKTNMMKIKHKLSDFHRTTETSWLWLHALMTVESSSP